MRLDENGLAWGWDNKLSKWVKGFPVDMRERIACGECSDDAPAQAEAKDPPGFTPDGPPSKASLEAAFATASKPHLRDTCTQNKVDWQGPDTRETLIAKLVANGVTELAAVIVEEPGPKAKAKA